MTSSLDAPGARLLASWGRLARLPAGPWLFSRALGRRVPYTGSLGARVEALERGRARVRLRDRRAVRNHLGSVHAVALANLGELATGLAVLTALPPGVRGIVLRLEVDYLRKARGTLTAEARWSPPEPPALPTLPAEAIAEARIHDAGDEIVAIVRSTWKLGATP